MADSTALVTESESKRLTQPFEAPLSELDKRLQELRSMPLSRTSVGLYQEWDGDAQKCLKALSNSELASQIGAAFKLVALPINAATSIIKGAASGLMALPGLLSAAASGARGVGSPGFNPGTRTGASSPGLRAPDSIGKVIAKGTTVCPSTAPGWPSLAACSIPGTFTPAASPMGAAIR